MTLRLQGKDVTEHAEVIEVEEGVIEGIRSFVAGYPFAARMFRLKGTHEGQIDESSLQAAASERVIVRTTLI